MHKNILYIMTVSLVINYTQAVWFSFDTIKDYISKELIITSAIGLGAFICYKHVQNNKKFCEEIAQAYDKFGYPGHGGNYNFQCGYWPFNYQFVAIPRKNTYTIVRNYSAGKKTIKSVKTTSFIAD